MGRSTGATIIAFLMVLLVQKEQNKDSKAIRLNSELNELLASYAGIAGCPAWPKRIAISPARIPLMRRKKTKSGNQPALKEITDV